MVVPGYILNELILESQEKDLRIYRATRLNGPETFLIKIFKEKKHSNGGLSDDRGDEESSNEEGRANQLKKRELHHHLRYIQSFSCDEGVCSVYEDEQNVQSLASLGDLSPQHFLRIAEALAQVLADFHAQRISLPSLSRDSFLFNKSSSQIHIVHLDPPKAFSSQADLEEDLKKLGQIYLQLAAPSQSDKDPNVHLDSVPELNDIINTLLNPTTCSTADSLLQDIRRIDKKIPNSEIQKITKNLEFDGVWLTSSMNALQKQNLSEELIASTAVSLVLLNGIRRSCLLSAKKTPSSISFSFLADSEKETLSLSHEKRISLIANQCFVSAKPVFSSDIGMDTSVENGEVQEGTEGIGYPFYGKEIKGVMYLEGTKLALHTLSQSHLFAAFISFLTVLLDNAALATKNLETTSNKFVESAVDLPDSASIWGNFFSKLSKRLDKLIIPAITPSNESKLNVLVENLEQWEFDIFEFDRLCEGRSLYYMSCVLFKKHNLIKHFNIEEKKLKNFMQLIDDGYRENPYHNSLHAADVAQTIHYFLTTGGLSTHLTEADILSMLVAAIIHDYRHPGLTNKFLIDTTDPVSIIYNDVSVLENFHLAESFAYLLNEETNILSSMPLQQKQEIRRSIIQTVLSTDLANHVSILSQVNEKSAKGGLELDRQLLLKIFIKSADISHPVKPNSLHKEWSSRLIEEFYLQGERESKQGLPISTFMDRKNPAVSNCQLGFIHFFVEPLFKATYSILSLEAQETLTKFLNENLKYWKEEQSKEELMKASNNH